MPLLPDLHIGLLNGWLLLVIYLLSLVLIVLTYPAEIRRKLFYEPAYPGEDPRRLVILSGRIAAISFVLLMIFTPLQTSGLYFNMGIAIYLIGFIIVMISLWTFRLTPAKEMVVADLYRKSRNPQWMGLVLVFIGTAATTAAWFPFILLAILFSAYHFQILLEEKACLDFYGEEYQAYMQNVPRYLLF